MNDIRIPFTRSPGRVSLSTLPAEDGSDSANSEPSVAGIEIVQQLFGSLHAAIEDRQAQQRQSLHELQLVAIELAAAAASWLTMTVIDRNQFNIEQLVARSIEELGGVAAVTVRLNPLDHQLFQRLQQADEVSPQLPAEVEIVSDVNVARGGCITESETISLVTDLETRLASVRQAWLENLDDAQTERRATGRNGWEPGRVPDRRETA